MKKSKLSRFLDIQDKKDVKFLEIKDKESYLKENAPFDIKFSDQKCCIHCGNIINVSEYKVIQKYNYFMKETYELIVCPNAPKCDGAIFDWYEQR
jgi:hypothetical protein